MCAQDVEKGGREKEEKKGDAEAGSVKCEADGSKKKELTN